MCRRGESRNFRGTTLIAAPKERPLVCSVIGEQPVWFTETKRPFCRLLMGDIQKSSLTALHQTGSSLKGKSLGPVPFIAFANS